METPLPFGWKSLNIDRYDGTTDPDEHVDLYITQVNLTNEDAIMCRVFSTSLKGAVLNWYTQLPMESIDNFDTLVRQFTVQYATSRPHHVTSAALASLRQGDDESLRAFMEFFVSISVKIRNLNLEVALHAMLMALKPGPFVATLCRRSPLDMDGLRAQATGKQKVNGERREAIITETQKLLNVGFIHEVRYTTWLANMVLVKKSLGKWRMCVDYTDLNKACPKDSYPLPSIDRLVDGASGHTLLSFLDAYSRYNQIMMYPPDEVYTSFITDHANFCYRVMPFGLKVFHQQIGRNMEVYVDDMVVKTTSVEDHAAELAEVFRQIREHNMRLNPEKCVFGVQGDKFFGFMITNRGIEANSEKCKAIIQMQSPQTVKDVQRLAGRLVSFSRFIPRLAKKAGPIFTLLRKPKNFEWMD
uniref:Transposon Ty3-I Gag-Pol polyprotein n=1 Tax=Cajanus cajan TaxID=3821 RepID=A0A151SD94_CAJCA|nr:Transposon Ty3-I Gag-Pol polyprotein [Cajanus cajan]